MTKLPGCSFSAPWNYGLVVSSGLVAPNIGLVANTVGLGASCYVRRSVYAC